LSAPRTRPTGLSLKSEGARSGWERAPSLGELKRDSPYEKSLYDILRNKRMKGNSEKIYFQAFFWYIEMVYFKRDLKAKGSLFVPNK
jgi:hypothetical protein